MRQIENQLSLIIIAVILDLITLFTCAMLGKNRMKGFVSAAFIYSIMTVSQIPVVYFLALVIKPLLNTAYLLEASIQIPELYYFGLFINNIIIACCSYIAFRWLCKTQNNLAIKQCILFSLFFISFALIILVWFSDIAVIISISYLSSALLGLLLTGILLLVFYLFTCSITRKEIAKMPDKNSFEYNQYIKDLSRRELEVIETILAGNISYKDISKKLNISVNTVKTHLKSIYQTTGVSNITALTMLFNGFSSIHPEITP